ncbi:unnamed protein product [Callosobruchus maculatus]|uniref:VTT domain-containing protein n=2 Tax=Callosobruchus maculatus TaxID=64391 RepID=A0A653DJ56_CALMS|nr:unnamed protein product [Callosobruchus maculatus]
MMITIDERDQSQNVPKKPSALRFTICRLLALLCTLSVILSILILFKTYIKSILLWLDKQDSLIIAVTICFLYILVSLPISIGYIVLVVATGYLFGIAKGLPLAMFGANFGLFVAHNVLKAVGHHHSIYRYTQNEMAQAIMRVITGPLCFKIVLCSRLTPIPFGLQNTIFAMSNVSGKIYHIASLFGLFPAQLVGVYVGSTLRSMQDVLEGNHISSATYIFAAIQLTIGASVMLYLGTKARRELLKVLAEADDSGKPPGYLIA